MGLSDIKDTLKALPLKEKATPVQMLMLIVSIVALLYLGGKISDAKNSITSSISVVDGKVNELTKSQKWIESSTLSKSEFATWAIELDHANRSVDPGKGILVPMPPPAIPSSAPAAAAPSP